MDTDFADRECLFCAATAARIEAVAAARKTPNDDRAPSGQNLNPTLERAKLSSGLVRQAPAETENDEVKISGSVPRLEICRQGIKANRSKTLTLCEPKELGHPQDLKVALRSKVAEWYHLLVIAVNSGNHRQQTRKAGPPARGGLLEKSRKWCLVAVALSAVFLLIGFDSFGEFRNQTMQFPAGSGDWLVVPGKRAGDLALGAPIKSIFELFPKPSIGSYTLPGRPGFVCGTDHIVGLLQDGKHPGFLHVFASDTKITEIEAGGARYRTADGIASNSPPEEVRLHYKGMKSHLLRHCCDESLNEGPLVLWTDQERGIAFSFTYPAKGDRRFVVSSFIIFRPKASFCTQGTVFPDSDSWLELPPYSLAPLAENATLR
ncbi:MAG: hypothetical protein WB987_18455 [Candidatus Acidiferrales bacterium]